MQDIGLHLLPRRAAVEVLALLRSSVSSVLIDAISDRVFQDGRITGDLQCTSSEELGIHVFGRKALLFRLMSGPGLCSPNLRLARTPRTLSFTPASSHREPRAERLQMRTFSLPEASWCDQHNGRKRAEEVLHPSREQTKLEQCLREVSGERLHIHINDGMRCEPI